MSTTAVRSPAEFEEQLQRYLYERSEEARAVRISDDGGEAEEVMTGIGDLGWSPDGNALIFHSGMADFASTSTRAIRLLNLGTRQISTFPGSEGLYSPRWSPDGRYIAALRVGSETLQILDVRTKRWTELAKIVVGFPMWSWDSKIHYLQQ